MFIPSKLIFENIHLIPFVTLDPPWCSWNTESPREKNLLEAIEADEFAVWKELSECQILNKFLYFKDTEEHSSQ